MEQAGQLLNEFRKEAGLSQTELSARSGVDLTTINRLECGRGPKPRPTTVRRLIKGLGLEDDDPRAKALVLTSARRIDLKAPMAAASQRSGSERAPKPPPLLSEVSARGVGYTPDDSGLTFEHHREQSLAGPLALAAPSGMQVLRSRDAVLSAAIQLLAAAGMPREGADEILLVIESNRDISEGISTELRDRLQSMWRGVLERGWNISHITPRKGSLRAPGITRSMLDLVGTKGAYVPRYVRPAETVPTSYEFLLVPEVGALLYFSTMQERHADAAFFYPQADQEPIRVLKDHFHLLQGNADTLMTVYPHMSVQYLDARTRGEEQEGHSFLVKSEVGLNVEPLALLKERYSAVLSEGGERADFVRSMIQYRERRWAAFRKQVERWRFLQICSATSLRALLEEGRLDPDDWLVRWEGKRVPLQVATTMLQAVVDLLEQHPNYEIAVVDEATLEDLSSDIFRTHWGVKVGKAATLQAWRPGPKGEQIAVALEITEPTTVADFANYFLKLWDRLVPDSGKNKKSVKDWLRDQIRTAQLRY